MLADGETVSLGSTNIYNNELDVVSESGQWLAECKRVETKQKSGFTNNLKRIGEKFNDNNKLNLCQRDFYKNKGDLNGIIEIGNTSNPIYNESSSQIKNRITTYLSETTSDKVRIGLESTKSITIINGTGRHVFTKGIHY